MYTSRETVLKNNSKIRYYEIVAKKDVDKILCSSVFSP